MIKVPLSYPYKFYVLKQSRRGSAVPREIPTQDMYTRTNPTSCHISGINKPCARSERYLNGIKN